MTASVNINTIVDFYPILGTLRNKLINIRHGRKVCVNGRYYTAGSVVGYAIECGDDPYDRVLLNEHRRLLDREFVSHWFTQDPTVLTNSEAMRIKIAAEHATAIGLAVGDAIIFEGRVYGVTRTPNNNIGLNRLGPDEVRGVMKLLNVEE